jgi:hypothetical protein
LESRQPSVSPKVIVYQSEAAVAGCGGLCIIGSFTLEGPVSTLRLLNLTFSMNATCPIDMQNDTTCGASLSQTVPQVSLGCDYCEIGCQIPLYRPYNGCSAIGLFETGTILRYSGWVESSMYAFLHPVTITITVTDEGPG